MALSGSLSRVLSMDIAMFQLRTEKMTSLEPKEGPFVCLHLTADFGEDVTGLNIFRMPLAPNKHLRYLSFESPTCYHIPITTINF